MLCIAWCMRARVGCSNVKGPAKLLGAEGVFVACVLVGLILNVGYRFMEFEGHTATWVFQDSQEYGCGRDSDARRVGLIFLTGMNRVTSQGRGDGTDTNATSPPNDALTTADGYGAFVEIRFQQSPWSTTLEAKSCTKAMCSLRWT